nr:MAG TPA: hypothetical protein [Bacteriophage sp.]
MSNKKLLFVELASGSKRLVKEDDTVLELNSTKVLEEVKAEDLVGWCVAYIRKERWPLLEDHKRLLDLDFSSPADEEVLMYVYDCKFKDIYKYERKLEIELAKILLAGKYLIKTLSYRPDIIENGKHKYPWKRVGRRSYDWVIPAGDYFDVDSGRRVEWRLPDVYNSR